MELSHLINGPGPEKTGNPSIQSPAPAAVRPAPPEKKQDQSSATPARQDELRLERRERKESPEADLIKRMIEKKKESEKTSYSDVLRIVSENAPHVLKSLKAIAAQRAGLESEKSTINPDTLKKAVEAAAGSPDPSRRVADVMNGVGLVPDELKEKFLQAAEAMLGMERQAGMTARPPIGLEGDPAIEFHPLTGNYEPQNVGFEVEVNFDLFFSVSARSSMKSGGHGAEAFYDASMEVAASFEAGFSMKIAGRFLSLADAAEGIDPEVLDAFSRAVEGLAGLDGDSLDRFFDATEKLFSDVEKKFGLEKGALGGVAVEMKETAAGFLRTVEAASREVFPGLKTDQIFELPEGMDRNGTTDLLAMLHDFAATRDEKSAVPALLNNLNGAENARSLSNSYQDLTSLEKLLEKTSEPV
jgi:hypothetical protein